VEGRTGRTGEVLVALHRGDCGEVGRRGVSEGVGAGGADGARDRQAGGDEIGGGDQIGLYFGEKGRE
jgi:hypothetical protein